LQPDRLNKRTSVARKWLEEGYSAGLNGRMAEWDREIRESEKDTSIKLCNRK